MGSCCASENPGPNKELKFNENTPALAPGTNEEKAIVTIQAHFRGILTRKTVKAKYGFEAREGGVGFKSIPNQVYDEATQEEQRQRVQKIKADLPPFEWGTAPEDDGVKRSLKEE